MTTPAKPGIIISGFPLIGKSGAIAKLKNQGVHAIDLESSAYKPGEGESRISPKTGLKVNPEGWENDYADDAMRLANSHHVVFTSSHPDIHKALHARNEHRKTIGQPKLGLHYVRPDNSLRAEYTQRSKDRGGIHDPAIQDAFGKVWISLWLLSKSLKLKEFKQLFYNLVSILLML